MVMMPEIVDVILHVFFGMTRMEPPDTPKSEVIIADALTAAGIEFAYERPFTGYDGTIRLPDFVIEDALGRGSADRQLVEREQEPRNEDAAAVGDNIDSDGVVRCSSVLRGKHNLELFAG